MRGLRIGIIVLLLPLVALCQEFRGTISGAVTDPTGAAVSGAKVVITEVATGTKSSTVVSTTGQYTVPFLAPGQYQVAVTAQGFKSFSRTGIDVTAGSHLVVDVHLQLGSASESVEVTAAPPLLDQANASVGQTITTKQVEDLPLDGRTPMMLAQLAVGVLATSDPSLVHPFDNNGAAAWSIGGTPSQTSELLLDGSPDEMWSGSLAYSPPQDAVQEVSIKAFDTDAAYGHTIGGTGNQILKSGTNQLHGSAYEFTQPAGIDANSFFNNSANAPRQATRFNQFGLTLGGPVVLPRIYDGHDKLFWFFAGEKLNDAQPNTDFTTVPTAAERQGDFSALLAQGPQYQLYNPFTAVQNGKNITRQPIANNIIPKNLLNPVALAYMNLFPQPNLPGDATGFDNYVNSSPTTDHFNNELGRIDYNMSQNSRIFFDFRHGYLQQVKNDYFGNGSTATTLDRENWGATADEVYTFNATTLLDLRANWTYMNEVHSTPVAGFDPTRLNFPSYVKTSSEYLQLPYVGFSGSCGSQVSFQCLGNTGPTVAPSQSEQFFGDVVKQWGNHSLKFGVDARDYRLDAINYGYSAGQYTFGTNWITSGTGAAAPPFGGDLASFLMGLPTSGRYDVNAKAVLHSYYYAPFIQDDWRISPTLTLNLGLRFDHDSPYVEQQGRTVNGFDFSGASPVAQAAEAAYAKKPIAQIPANQFQVLGGLTFASPNNGAIYQTTSHLFSPRLGFSWSPEFLPHNTVVRGGVGMFVSPTTLATLSPNGKYSSNPLLDQEGFSASTPFVATNDNYLTPASTLSDPFSGGISQPAGSSLGLSTFLGQTVTFMNPEMKDPYAVRWNLGVQHQFASNLMGEIDYMGNHAVHLPVQNTQLNVIPRQYLSTLDTRDQTVINELTASVANPFAGLLPGTSLNGSKVSVAQLLAVYPEFPVGSGSTSTGVIMQNNTIGSSYFESLDLRLERRFSHGLSVIATYEFSKLIEQDSYLNDTDPVPTRMISSFDHPQHFVLASSYQLPIGPGAWLPLPSGWANFLFGGWHLNGIYTHQTGQPIYWSNDMVYNGSPLTVDPRQTNGPAFNTSAFDTNSKDQFQYHIRTFPYTVSNLRQDGINNLDASLLKSFNFSERRYLQLRVETFNLMNHADFAAPNVSPTSKSFGTITSQANRPRQIQIGARFVF